MQVSPVAVMTSGVMQLLPACSWAPYEVPAAARLLESLRPRELALPAAGPCAPVCLKTQDYTPELLITQESQGALNLSPLM